MISIAFVVCATVAAVAANDDSGDHYWNSEIHGHYCNIDVYSNDLNEVCGPNNAVYGHYPGFLASPVRVRRATVFVANEFYRIQNDANFDRRRCHDECLFGLDGQFDAELQDANDYSMYVGLNQMISGIRYGEGVCYAQLSWECCSDWQTRLSH